jgi:hypothetical protein
MFDKCAWNYCFACWVFVWNTETLTANYIIELYLCNEPTRCNIYLQFTEFPRLYMFLVHL